MIFKVSLFDHKKDNVPKSVEWNASELVQHLTTPALRSEKDGPLWSPARFKEGTLRANENVEAVSCLVLDCDHGVKIEEAREVWKAYRGLIYTSFSHTQEAHRFRLVFPLASPIPGDRFPLLWRWTQAGMGFASDPACKDPSRMYYLPVKSSESAPFVADWWKGIALDWRILDLKEEPQRTPSYRATINVSTEGEKAERNLARLSASRADDYHDWLRIGCALKELGEEGFPLWDAWSRKSAKYPGEEELRYKWETLGRRVSGKVCTLASLQWMADRDSPKPSGNGARPVSISQKREHSEELGYFEESLNSEECEIRLFNNTDLGNAERLVHRFGDRIRYCHAFKQWFLWDGRYWMPDKTEGILRLAALTVRAIHHEMDLLADEDQRKRKAAWGFQSESKGSLVAMVSLAQALPSVPIEPSQLDTNPYLFNCENGTIDLQTGKLRHFRQEDYITKMAPVKFDVDATCPLFEQFLSQVFEEKSRLIEFVRRSIGYSLSGITSERQMFVCYGTGSNGKSTLLYLFSKLLGDYGAATSMETFLAKKGDTIPNDLAALVGARFVTASEIEEGRKLSLTVVKQATGHKDKITARFLRAEFFSFYPEFKIWLAVNHRPQIKDTTESIWDRVRLIPFNRRFGTGEKDEGLAEKLETELSGILNWAVQGCLEWQTIGLPVEENVEQATREYRESQDPITPFLEEDCLLDPVATVPVSLLWEAYQEFVKENGQKWGILRQEFNQRLEARGCCRKVDKNDSRKSVKIWCGIRLKTQEDVENSSMSTVSTGVYHDSDIIRAQLPREEIYTKNAVDTVDTVDNEKEEFLAHVCRLCDEPAIMLAADHYHYCKKHLTIYHKSLE